MMDLEDALVAYVRSKAEHPRNGRMRFVVSAAQTPGEGEVRAGARHQHRSHHIRPLTHALIHSLTNEQMNK